MKVLKNIWFTVTVFRRDWNKFAGGSFDIVLKLGNTEQTHRVRFFEAQYAGGDRGSLVPYPGGRVLGVQGSDHRIYYSDKVEVPCTEQLGGNKWVLHEGPWDVPPDANGTNWNGSPSNWAAWSPTLWDQEYEADGYNGQRWEGDDGDPYNGGNSIPLGVYGGVNNVHFGVKRDDAELCEVNGSPTCDPTACRQSDPLAEPPVVFDPEGPLIYDDDEEWYYVDPLLINNFSACDPTPCPSGDRNADGSCPLPPLWVATTQYAKGALVSHDDAIGQIIPYYANQLVPAATPAPLAATFFWDPLVNSATPGVPSSYSGGGSWYTSAVPIPPGATLEIVICPKEAIDPCNPDPPCSTASLDDAYILTFTWNGPGDLPPHADIPRYLGENEAIPADWGKYVWDTLQPPPPDATEDNAVYFPPGFTVDLNAPPRKVTPNFGRTDPAYSLCVGACVSTRPEGGDWTLIDYLDCDVPSWRGGNSPYNDPFNPLHRASEYQKSISRGDAGYSNARDTLKLLSGSLTAGTFEVTEGFGPLGYKAIGKHWVISGGVVFEDTEAIGLLVPSNNEGGTDPMTGLLHHTHDIKFFVEKNSSLVPPQPSLNDLPDYNITNDVTVGMWVQDGTNVVNYDDTGYSAILTIANTEFYNGLVGNTVYFADYVQHTPDGIPPYTYKTEEKAGIITGFSDAKFYFPEGKSWLDYPGFAQEESDQSTYLTVPFGHMLLDTDGDGTCDKTVETWLHKDPDALLPWSLDQGWINQNIPDPVNGVNPLEPEIFEGCDVCDPEHAPSAARATHVRIRLNVAIPGREVGDIIRVHITNFAPIASGSGKCTDHTPSFESNPRQVGVGTPPPPPTLPPPVPPTTPPTTPPPETGYFPKCTDDKLCITIGGTSYEFWRQSDSYDDGWSGNPEIPHERKNGKDWYVSRPSSGGNWPTGPGGFIETSILGTTSGPYYLSFGESTSTKWQVYRGVETYDSDEAAGTYCPTEAGFAGLSIATGGCPGASSPPPPPPSPVHGCMDSSAVNYVPWATQDDGSCVYQGETVMDPWHRDIKSIEVNDKIYEWVEQPCFTILEATNTSPIVITTAGFDGVAKPMNLADGDTVIIDDVKGNPAANGVFTILNVAGDPTKIQLVGSTGNGLYAPWDQYLAFDRPEVHFIIRKCIAANPVRMLVAGAWDAAFNGVYKEGSEVFGYNSYIHVDDNTKEFSITWDGQWVLKHAGVPQAYATRTSAIECTPSDATWHSVVPSAMTVNSICGIPELSVTGHGDGTVNGKYVINDSSFGTPGSLWEALLSGFPTWIQTEDSTGAAVTAPHFIGVGDWYSQQVGEVPLLTHWHIRTVVPGVNATKARVSNASTAPVYDCPTQQAWPVVTMTAL